MILRRLSLLSLILAGLSGCALNPGRTPYLFGNSQAQPREATTASGRVRGVATPIGQAFLGVPFAAPPTGPLRFRPPQPPVAWTETRDATHAGPMCPQAHIPGSGAQSEDCLTLNVYAPHDAGAGALKPVMVWFYGGGFEIGYNTQYDPSRLAEREGVLVVAPNYRLGALGFLAHPALKGAGEGAYAIADQQAALRWVRDNIAAFGGDPANVTIFGESAGGWSTYYHLAAPGSRGLFHKAIIESGACTSKDSVTPLADAETGGLAYASGLGCADPTTAADCLRALPVKKLMGAKARRRGLLGIDSWGPVSGSDILPERPQDVFAAGRSAAVPVMLGTNRNEGRLFLYSNRLQGKLYTRASYEKIIGDFFEGDTPAVFAEYEGEYRRRGLGLAYGDVVTDATFSCPAQRLAALLRASAPVYAYEFADPEALLAVPRLPIAPPLGAYHSSEIAYVFGTRWAVADPAKFTPAQRALSERMQDAWGAFARTGHPGEGAVSAWPADADGRPIRLSPSGPGFAEDFAVAHHCAFWATLAR